MHLPRPEQLLARLDAIGQSLEHHPQALALIGLGSVGQETRRLDEWSNLDFFLIVQAGHAARFIENLDWLAAAHPLAWHFRHSADGHKALMADGVFCEFAVLEPPQLDAVAYAPGRLVWLRRGANPMWALPQRPLPAATPRDEAWLVNEALSCLLVGLQRWHRGERLSAARWVQGQAVDRLIALDALRHTPAPGADPFNRERRLEQRQPTLAPELPGLVPGYAETPAAALALLAALRQRGALLNAAAVARIETLAQRR